MSNLEDTEVLLALVSSLLRDPVDDQASLLDALVRANGNVEEAVRLIEAKNDDPTEHTAEYADGQAGGKRKRRAGLDQWLLSSEKPLSHATDASSSPAKRPRSRRSATPTQHSNTAVTFRESVSDFVEGSSRPVVSPAKAKPVSQSEFLTLFRSPNPAELPQKATPLKFPPLTLATPELVAKHSPCSMHLSVLPPELACRLYHIMLDESEGWHRNKWWLFDRVVESPHRTSFYIRRSPVGTKDIDMQEAAQYWYNGRPTPPPDYFPPALEEACAYVERVVNAEMRKRARFPLEWGGVPSQSENGSSSTSEHVLWRANVAASNRYEGASESVGFHSDQLTYLGPYPTIASLSLGTTRTFRLREVIPTDEKDIRSARTYNIPLVHNSLTIMHASCQETFKHSIPPQKVIDAFRPPFPSPTQFSPKNTEETDQAPPPIGAQTIPTSNARINITFRFYRPDFQPSSIPRCRCGVPCILRPDMKNRYAAPAEEEKTIVTKYWWTCYAGAQNDGKGCGMWKVMDVEAEGRGPFANGDNFSTIVPG